MFLEGLRHRRLDDIHSEFWFVTWSNCVNNMERAYEEVYEELGVIYMEMVVNRKLFYEIA